MEAWPVDLHGDATRRHFLTKADADTEGLRPLDGVNAREARLAADWMEN
jgi:hypothetical protein